MISCQDDAPGFRRGVFVWFYGVVFFILHRRHLDHEYSVAAGLQMADWWQTQVGGGVARSLEWNLTRNIHFRLRRTL